MFSVIVQGPTGGRRTAPANKLSIGGAVLAAIAASACCIGPIALAALGIGGAGAMAGVGAYRPHLLGVTGALLVCGFYFTYRKPKADACGCEPDKSRRRGRIALWIATFVVVAAAASPLWLERWSEARAAVPLTDPSLERAAIVVQGIDCEACAGPIRDALTKVGGFRDLRLDVPSRTIFVTFEPAAGRLEAYAAAIADLGFEPQL